MCVNQTHCVFFGLCVDYRESSSIVLYHCSFAFASCDFPLQASHSQLFPGQKEEEDEEEEEGKGERRKTEKKSERSFHRQSGQNPTSLYRLIKTPYMLDQTETECVNTKQNKTKQNLPN